MFFSTGWILLIIGVLGAASCIVAMVAMYRKLDDRKKDFSKG